MIRIDSYDAAGSKGISHLGKDEKLLEILDILFGEDKDIIKLLSEENEHMFEIDFAANRVTEYQAEGLFIDKAKYLPDDANIINVHTHPLGSLLIPGIDVMITSSGFPSITDLSTLLDATIHYSLQDGKFCPVTQYVVGWEGDVVRITSYRFSKETIYYCIEKNKNKTRTLKQNKTRTLKKNKTRTLKQNLMTAFTIVLEDKELRENFFDSILEEINSNVLEGYKVLRVSSILYDPTVV